tara:strand:+ start:2592 stop:3494 length:903 start_codon:yes stop_codon:yes gene_type:complete
MKILLIGSSGQLGSQIIKSAPRNINLLTPSRIELNLSKEKECYEYVINSSPDWVINCGAYTNVDQAEEDQEVAYKINALGPKALAKALSITGGKLLHVSTDYVFSGNQNSPYKTNQIISPINFYGTSKGQGEEFIQNILYKNNQLCILRTSWLMGANGKNFITKMIKLFNERKEIKVVYDQISSPTTTSSLANAIWKTIKINFEYTKINKSIPSLNHFSNDGVASWYDVAVSIGEIVEKIGLIKKVPIIVPVESNEFPTIASRPKYSVLESKETKKIIGLKNSHWRIELFKELSNYSKFK